MNDGKLTTEQRKKFEGWINSKSTLIGKCPICSDRRWTLIDHFVDLPIYRGGNVVLGGGISYPSVGMVCTNCGNTQLINAMISGIIPEDGADSKPPVNASNE
jgi:hypothetical protein